MRIVAVAALLTSLLAAQTPTAGLADELGQDPAALLRTIGSATDNDTLRRRAEACRSRLTNPQRLSLLRFGLGHADERVVFGAVAVLDSHPLPVPELRHAAQVVLPRIGDPDCPLAAGDGNQLFGSVDVPLLLQRLPHLTEEDANRWLGAMHRVVRPEHIPLLCEFARHSTPRLARHAHGNAKIAADFSGHHFDVVVATWLHLLGEAPDEHDSDAGLPGVLTAALRYHLDHEEPRRTREDDERDEAWLHPVWPTACCRHWLEQSTPSARDLPLLQRLLTEGWRSAALLAIGNARLQEAMPLLRAEAIPETQHTEAYVEELAQHLSQNERTTRGIAWLTSAQEQDVRQRAEAMANEMFGHPSDPDRLLARARLGDAEATAALPTTARGRLLACTVLPPSERRTHARACLLLPVEQTLDLLAEIRGAHACDSDAVLPGWSDDWFSDFEPSASELPELDVRVLRALVASIPSAATQRLADRLLTFPPTALFARPLDPAFDFGTAGVLPFLEVTHPVAFRARLREGLAGPDAEVADLCAHSLLRLGDIASSARLRARFERDPQTWHGRNTWETDEALLDLARCLDMADAAWFAGHERSLADANALPLLGAIAHTLGMPLEAARRWRIAPDRVPAVREALHRGDVVAAWLQTAAENDGAVVAACLWPDARVQRAVDERLAGMQGELQHVVLLQSLVGVRRGDAAALRALRDLCADGRYAVHNCEWPAALTLDADVRTLPFWIAEAGANCCRNSSVAKEAMQSFFRDGNTYMHDATRKLRRRLPRLDGLRWSQLARSYVYVGQ